MRTENGQNNNNKHRTKERENVNKIYNLLFEYQ